MSDELERRRAVLAEREQKLADYRRLRSVRQLGPDEATLVDQAIAGYEAAVLEMHLHLDDDLPE